MLMYPDGELTLAGIIVVAACVVYFIASFVLIFKLLNLCSDFQEALKIMRRQAGVREHNGKLVPIDEDGNIKGA
ncbi:MAG: hypothetical protein IJB03_04995 [Alistipes sp.]|nr:hypothetical protein [Alistipes sp.]